MARNSQVKTWFFIFLLFSAHAYRLDVGQKATKAQTKAHTKLVSQAVSFSNVSASQVVAYGSLSASYSYSRSFTQSTTVIQTSSGYASRTSIASMSEHCIPGMYTPLTMQPKTPPNPGLSPVWGLLLATAVVLMGGLYLYHQHRLNSPLEATFCPVSSWEQDPAGVLVSAGPRSAHESYGEISSFLHEDAANSRGMPKCSGLRRHRLRTDCDGDVDCKRQACRQMCCDRRDCTFFQFNNIDSTDYCWLGSRSRLDPNTCEQPWFGETCTSCRDRRVELWPQIHSDNSKCQSSLFGTGFHVNNQYECQSHATEVGHEYYQYDVTRGRCETAETCDTPSANTIHNWRIFSRHDVDMPEPSNAQVPPDQETWQFEPFLFHSHTGMTSVSLTVAEQCATGDVTCMRDVCRTKCLQEAGCIHYQFENGGSECSLGVDHVIEEDNVGMWFGGILTENRLCAADEFKCPSTENCVDQCGECPGFGRDGADNFCVRSAIENMVDAAMWVDNYDAAPIDAWCRGFERTVVTMSAGMATGQSGADICRAACASDPTCAVWQMYTQDAERSDYAQNSHVRCWLGMEDNMGRPLFSCTGRSPKRWRLLSAPRAEAIDRRGCQDGKVACILNNNCVDLCQDECPGFTITDVDAGLCQPPTNPSNVRQDGVPMNVAMAGNLPRAQANPDNSMYADEGDLFTMSVNIERIINPETFEGDTTAVCDVIAGAECDLIDGACVCEYEDENTCDDLFGHPERIVPVLAEEGMLLLSQQGCSCSGTTCTLSLMNSVPPVRVGEVETAAIHIGSDEWEYCDDTVCPNMDTCAPLTYGAHGCGYQCQRETEAYWCSSRCDCNQAEAVVDCEVGVMCPDMHHCEPISYGEYGCGYGCTKDSTYYFCSDNCGECNV